MKKSKNLHSDLFLSEQILERFSHKRKISCSLLEKMNALQAAPWLLGKVLEAGPEKSPVSGIITETEAYCGETDRACHAFGGKRTERTEVMYRKGGHVYIYLCYGMYDLLNIVVHKKGVPEAVLIRAVFPYEGLNQILKNRKAERWMPHLLNGPGKVTLGLDIRRRLNGTQIGEHIRLFDLGLPISKNMVIQTPRIGVDYAGKDAFLPYRFLFDIRKWGGDFFEK